MKSITRLAVAAVFVLGFSSCKKDYTCTCRDAAGAVTLDVYPYNDMKKKDAEQACNAWHSIYIPSGGACTLD